MEQRTAGSDAALGELSCDRLKPVLRWPAQRAEHCEPEGEKAEDARHHHDRPADVVVERPGPDGEDGTPNHDRHHDPADDPVGTGRGKGRRHANVIDAPQANRGARKQRPPERSRPQGGGEPEPFPGAIGRSPHVKPEAPAASVLPACLGWGHSICPVSLQAGGQ